MVYKVIKTESEYNAALTELETLFDARKGTEEGDKLELLSLLVDNYEKEHFPMALPDPIEAIKFRMEQLNCKSKDLESILGFKSRVSEILNRKRKLTLSMIRKLNKSLQIPTDVLIQEY